MLTIPLGYGQQLAESLCAKERVASCGMLLSALAARNRPSALAPLPLMRGWAVTLACDVAAGCVASNHQHT
jgi:hypothetical protein